jgi:hypothetical protein
VDFREIECEAIDWIPRAKASVQYGSVLRTCCVFKIPTIALMQY